MAPTLDDSGFSNLTSCGFLPFSQTLKFSPWREKIDNDWRQFCIERKVQYDNDAFHVACATHIGTNKSVLKYDKTYPPSISQLEFKTVLRDLKNFFYNLKDKCPILQFDEVLINPDAVPGIVLSKWFGMEDKREAAIKMADYCDLFWNVAHEENYPWLWKQANKVELLKISKLMNTDIRGFTIIPFEAFMYTARMSQSMNEEMCKPEFYNTSPIKHGIAMAHGGFQNLMRELRFKLGPDVEIIEGDCIKWDSGMLDLLFEAVMQIRFLCWNKEGMSEEEWWKRTRYSYSQIKESFICLTTGQIIQKMFGNPSGQTSTTDDNCIGHLFVLCAIWRRKYGRSLFSDYRERVNLAIYADDHIIVAQKDLDFGNFESRRAEYIRLGCDLDPAKDFVSDSYEGHTFLGLTAKWDDYLKIYCPHFSSLKAHNTLAKYEKTYTIEQVFDRAATVLLLVSFDDATYKTIWEYLRYLQIKYPADLSYRKIPTPSICRSFWLCREANHEEGGLEATKSFFAEPEVKRKQQAFNPVQMTKSKAQKQRIAQARNQKTELIAVLKKKRNRKPKVQTQIVRRPTGAKINWNKIQKPQGTNALRMDNFMPKFTDGTGRSLTNSTGNVVRKQNPIMDYIATLCDPAHNIARIPDGFARPTGCFRSVNSFSVPVLQDAFNQGRFSFALQPKFGSLSSPLTYQCAVANSAQIAESAAPWQEVDWSLAANYLGSLQNQGADPRLDINAGFLTTQEPSYFGDNWAIGTSTDLSNKSLFSGMVQNYDPDNVGPVLNFFSPNAQTPYTGVTQSFVKLPFGDWNISITAKFQMSTTAGAAEAINFQSIAGSANGTGVLYVGIQQQQTPTVTTATTYVVSATAQVVSKPGNNSLSFCISNVQSGLTNATADPNVTSVSATYLTATSANFASSNVYSDAGVISEVRPVGMAVLCTYMGTLLNNGGEIASAYVPYKTIQNNYFQLNTSGIGQLQLYEQLRRLDRAYDGPISDGTYAIWAPYSPEDLDFVSPGEMNISEYPGIIVSGIFSPDAAVSTTQPTIRVMVYICYEFVTKYTIFETVSLIGSQAMIDAAFAVVKGENFCCKNKEHLAWIRSVLKKAVAFYSKHSSVINPMLMAAGAALL